MTRRDARATFTVPWRPRRNKCSDWSARRRWWLLAASLLVVKRRLLVRRKKLPRAWTALLPHRGRLLCHVLLITASAFAENSRIGILGDDDRRMIEERGTPWSAIGQINVTGYRRITWCTGSLVAPNLVVTAAHCVINPWSWKPYPLHQLHFLAGVRGSSWLGHSTAKCLHFPAEYEYVGRENYSNPTSKGSSGCLCARCGADRVEDDVNDIPSLELDSGAMQNSDVTLVHASYPADRRYMLTAHFGCRLLERNQDLWLTDCDTTAASSGGPVFVQRNGNLESPPSWWG